MQRTPLRFYLAFAVSLVFALFMALSTSEPLDWTPSFTQEDKVPFGSYILFELLPELFPGRKISTAERPIYNVLQDSTTGDANYVFVNTVFQPDDLDVRELLDFVAAGNSAFIAAQGFGGPLADSLNIDTEVDVTLSDSSTGGFDDPGLQHETGYGFTKGSASFYFSKYDTARAVPLGWMSAGPVNFIRVDFGKGHFLLSSLPLAFTNFNMLYQDNAEYVATALSHLPVRDTVWDEYYKAGRRLAETPLRFILSKEPLRWAYYVGLVALLLFIIFEGRRRQRVIPVIQPLRNTTVDFVETTGRLYFQNGDHRDLVGKKVAHFLDTVRERFRLPASDLSDGLAGNLAVKLNQPEEEVKQLFEKLRKHLQAPAILATDLVEIDRRIEAFYRNSDGKIE